MLSKLPLTGVLMGLLAGTACAKSPASPAPMHVQVTGLTVTPGQGQSFLTFNEAEDPAAHYRVYRSGDAILDGAQLALADFLGEIDGNSSLNLRLTELTGTPLTFTITDQGQPLSTDQGLFVHTIESPGRGYYAVTLVDGLGNEDTQLLPGVNTTLTGVNETPAPPRPIEQAAGGQLAVFVHWVSDRDTPFAPAMASLPSQAFNLKVVFDDTLGAEPRPVLVQLHERGGSFLGIPTSSHPEAIVLAPDDWLPFDPINTYWYGYNPDFPAPPGPGSPPNVDYTVRRVLAELDWLLANYPSDADRVYAAGLSMGGAGAVSLAYRYPERFAAAAGLEPKFDWGCQENGCWNAAETGNLLWGSTALDLDCSEGIKTYDRLDAGFLLNRSAEDLTQIDPLVARPAILTLSGRQDNVVGWAEKPVFFQAVQAAQQAAVFLWDNGTHNGPNASATGPWLEGYQVLENELWGYSKSKPYPAFTQFGLDADAGDGAPIDGDLLGAINASILFDPETSVESALQYRVEVRLRSGSGLESTNATQALIDWTPRGLVLFQPKPGNSIRFENYSLADGSLIQSDLIKPSASGLYTATRAIVLRTGNRFVLLDTSTAPFGFQLPPPNQLELDISGVVGIGMAAEFKLTGLDKQASGAIVVLSLGKSQTPYLGGVLLLNPSLQFQVLNATVAAGQASAALQLPMALKLVGRTFYAQGIANSSLGPQGVLFSNGLTMVVSL